MRRRSPVVPVSLLSLLAVVAPSSATAQDVFLLIPGLDGGSKDQQFAGAFDAVAITSGISSDPEGRPTFSPVIVKLKGPSPGSPGLEQAVATGQRFPQAVAALRRSGDNPFVFITYTLTDVAVTSFQRVVGPEETPFESVSLTYGRIQTEYHQQNADGSAAPAVVVCWDARKNAQCE